ncbi:MAG TPA: hypothetical protein VF440_12010 [Novosphingobium sp.]
MSRGSAEIAGSRAADEALRDWQALRADETIQFAPLPPPKPPTTPDWMKWLGEALAPVFQAIGDALHWLLAPLARLLGLSWGTMRLVLIALAVLLVLTLLWRIVPPLLARLRPQAAPAEPEWAPQRTAAVALLEDADRLAAEGRFGEAAHLLLQRSVHHIAEARPGWLLPASTAREIATLPALPERARRAFAAIAERVERSLFALRPLDAADWTAARAAYADFALERLGDTA